MHASIPPIHYPGQVAAASGGAAYVASARSAVCLEGSPTAASDRRELALPSMPRRVYRKVTPPCRRETFSRGEPATQRS